MTITNVKTLFFPKSTRQRGYSKLMFFVEDNVRNSKYDSTFKNSHKPQPQQKHFSNCCNCSEEPPTYTKKNEEDEVMCGNIDQNEQSKLVYQ